MSIKKCRKVEAILIVAVLVVSESRHAHRNIRFNDGLKSDIASRKDAVFASALLSMASPPVAFRLGLGAPGRPSTLPSIGTFQKPAVAQQAPSLPLTALLTTSRSQGILMSAEDSVETEETEEAVETEETSEAAVETEESDLPPAKGIKSLLASLIKSVKNAANEVDVVLLLCFAWWYLGNFFCNVQTKNALRASGGPTGFPLSITSLQLGVGVVWSTFLWSLSGVEGGISRTPPTITRKDWLSTLPVGAMSAAAHASTMLSLSAGAVSFVQIIKCLEPAFAAAIGTLAYGAKVSAGRWFSLVPVIGGVALASIGEVKGGASFDKMLIGSAVTAAIANVFAAVRANENKKLMVTEGLKDRIGSASNQFALTIINSFLCLLPVTLLFEGHKLGQFFQILLRRPNLLTNAVGSGIWFYLYNEMATITIKKTDALTSSVASTAKRVIVIVFMAFVMNESLSPMKLLGSSIGVGGVFLYSIIDKLVARFQQKKKEA